MNTNVETGYTDRMASHRELLDRVKQQDWFGRKATFRVVSELVFHVATCVAGIYLFLVSDNILVMLIGLVISTLGSLGLSTNTHTSSHNATSRSNRINAFLTYFGYPFLLGMPATYWWNKHVVVHHPTPNVKGVDDDIDVMPWFAIADEDYQQSTGWRRIYYRYQWLLIPFAIFLNGFGVQWTGWKFLINALKDDTVRRRRHWIDLGVMGIHYAVWVFIPLLFFPVLDVLGFYLIRIGLMGYAIFIGFAPAHFPPEAALAGPEELEADYLRLQTATTVNFKTNFFGRLLCSGVDYQIEHHLFPYIPHVYYPKLSPIVKQYCEEKGYPYRTLGWGEATWKSLAVFKWRKKRVDDLRTVSG